MIHFEIKHPAFQPEGLGFLPIFWDESDPRPAQEQANTAYSHGGGYNPFKGFTLTEKGLVYPGDPPMRLLAEARLHDKETIRLYEASWVVILQDDGSFVASRMD